MDPQVPFHLVTIEYGAKVILDLYNYILIVTNFTLVVFLEHPAGASWYPWDVSRFEK